MRTFSSCVWKCLFWVLHLYFEIVKGAWLYFLMAEAISYLLSVQGSYILAAFVIYTTLRYLV